MRFLNILFVVIFFCHISVSQIIPSVDIKTLDGKTINSASFDNNGDPIVISFWALWCKNCIKELEAISEIYEDWQDETNVKLIAISIDDSRNTSKLKPFVNTKGWEYEIYHDPNSDFKRALGINQIPHTFLLNGKNEIISEHVGYTDGQEEELYDKIIKLIK
jgi:thiol-disulfide isomerase/thioredoxin